MFVHYPEADEENRELSKKAAAVHATAILRRLRDLPCPKEQKTKLYDEIIKAYRDER